MTKEQLIIGNELILRTFLYKKGEHIDTYVSESKFLWDGEYGFHEKPSTLLKILNKLKKKHYISIICNGGVFTITIKRDILDNINNVVICDGSDGDFTVCLWCGIVNYLRIKKIEFEKLVRYHIKHTLPYPYNEKDNVCEIVKSDYEDYKGIFIEEDI
ncbi:MAG: hypothetical protein ACOC22_01635 [bacterium]